MKANHSIRIHKHYDSRELPIGRVLIAIMLVSVSTLAADVLAQGGSPRLLARNISGENSVSTNQLVTPDRALHAVQRARNHLIAGRIDRAQREITYALDISPHCALALNVQGAIHLVTRQFENASEDYHGAIQADSELGSAYLGLAISLIAQDHLNEALEPLDRAARLLPSSWLVYFETAGARLGLGDTEAALKQIGYAERFNEMDPERKSGTVYLRGMVYVNLRDYDRAKKYLGDAISYDPNGFYATLAQRRLEHLRPLHANVE